MWHWDSLLLIFHSPSPLYNRSDDTVLIHRLLLVALIAAQSVLRGPRQAAKFTDD